MSPTWSRNTRVGARWYLEASQHMQIKVLMEKLHTLETGIEPGSDTGSNA